MQIYRYTLDVCDTYTTCDECVNTGDLFCGWCTLEKRLLLHERMLITIMKNRLAKRAIKMIRTLVSFRIGVVIQAYGNVILCNLHVHYFQAL